MKQNPRRENFAFGDSEIFSGKCKGKRERERENTGPTDQEGDKWNTVNIYIQLINEEI